jgi:PTS system mannose-specific IID component
VSERLPPTTVTATLLRSFLIQGSWNYHTMIGTGFAFAMLPGLRRIFGDDVASLDASLERHVEHFNAHPYLSTVALGASLRMEQEGADAVTVRRFKSAVKGPLGGLGDQLVWATWLPGVAVLALVVYWFGAPAGIVVGLFLTVYNVGHVGLRIWGLRVGLQSGRAVGGRLAEADLAGWTRKLQPVVVLLLGILMGALVGGEGESATLRGPWGLLGLVGFLAGLLGGHRTWRPAAVVTATAIGAIASWGVLSS